MTVYVQRRCRQRQGMLVMMRMRYRWEEDSKGITARVTVMTEWRSERNSPPKARRVKP